jgi:protoporphyrinogen oxidase
VLQRCQEVQVVTWPLSRLVAFLQAWKFSSIFHLRHITSTSLASVTWVGDQQRKKETVRV